MNRYDDDFEGNSEILIQPRSKHNTYGFKYTSKESLDSVEGRLPYGTTISGVEVVVLQPDKITTVSGLIDSSPSIVDDYVFVSMSYPIGLLSGTYYLRFVLTLDNGEEHESDFHRVIVRDK